jgi:MerR family transcriptional regulator/heat shock protein HspR
MNKILEESSLEKHNPVFTLSVTSRLSGIPTTSIRQYVNRGLIIPFKKETGRHLFSQEDVQRLKYIHEQLNIMGLNIAGIRTLFALIPCWAIRKCSINDRLNCMGYNSVTKPCWEASEKGRECRNTECRECGVYRIFEDHKDIKSLIKTLILNT